MRFFFKLKETSCYGDTRGKVSAKRIKVGREIVVE